MATKGAGFESVIARQLSMWWSAGVRDDLVWRTAGSGGRATARGKRGKATVNAAGDLGPTDASIQPLFDVFCWELKRGYSTVVSTGFLDRKADAPFTIKKSWNAWYAQALASQADAKAAAWAIVHRRDGHEPLVYFDAAAPLVSPKFNDLSSLAVMTIRNGRLRTKSGDVISVDVVAYRFNDLFGIDASGWPTGLSPQAVTDYAGARRTKVDS